MTAHGVGFNRGLSTSRSGLFGGASRAQMVSLLSLIALASFSSSAVSVLVPELTVEFSSVRLVPWVATSFLLTSSVVIIGAGWVLDSFGLRSSLRWSSGVYLAASFGCALSPSIEVLIAMRAVQGLGAGWGLTTAIAGIGVSVPSSYRARAFAANSVVWGSVTLAAPVVAAAMTPIMGWRGLFMLNGFAAIPVAILGWRPFVLSRVVARQSMDLIGFLLLVVGVIGLTIWSSDLSLRLAIVVVPFVVIAAVGYVWHSKRISNPIIDLELLIRRPFVLIHLAGAMSFGAAVGLDNFVPLFVRAGLGGSRSDAALAVIAMSLGWTVASLAIARVLGDGSESVGAVVGYVLLLVGLVLLSLLARPEMGLLEVVGVMAVVGAGAGSVSSSMFVLIQRTAHVDAMGRATSAHQLARGISQTSGTAVVAAIILTVVQHRTGSSDALRLLADDHLTLDPRTAARAVSDGFRRATALLTGLSLVGLVAASALAGTDRRAVGAFAELTEFQPDVLDS